MESTSDFDLVDAPEFLEFLKQQNLSEESLEYIGNETKRSFDEYIESSNKILQLCWLKASSSALNVQGLGNNQENRAPPGTSSKPTRTKRSIRNSSVKNGKASTKTNRKLSKAKSYIAKQDVNNFLSQELEEKATVSNLVQEEIAEDLQGEVPRGKVRIEIISDFISETKSPHEGEVRFVEPTSNASHLCKIGRSSGKEYSEHGVSLNLDLEVSTKHGMLTRTGNKNGYEYFFTDVGSTNGTFDVETGDRLNVNEKYKLENGTELRLGQSVLRFKFST